MGDMRQCVKVQLYNVCADGLDEKFELREHYDMAIAVRDILQVNLIRLLRLEKQNLLMTN